MKDKLFESINDYFDANLNESDDPQIDRKDYRDYMSFILFISTFADEMERLGLHKEIHGELTETVPAFFEVNGFDIYEFVPKNVGREIVEKVDEFWKGKMTVADLVRHDEDAAYRLAMQAIGSGVAIDDDKETEEFLEDLGIKDLHSIPFPSVEMELYDAVADAVEKLHLNEKGGGEGGEEDPSFDDIQEPVESIQKKVFGEKGA